VEDGALLGTRALNRALLARQHLLARADGPALDLLEHLVGLQAQEPQEPYVGVWSRLRDFVPAELSELLVRRDAVRVLLMRRTLHLVSARDCLCLRRLHDPMLVARMRGTLGRRLPGVDEEALAAAGRPLFAAAPSTLTEVARAIGDRWPQVAARDLGDALSTLLPLVQVPPRGLWRQTAPACNTTIDMWLGAEPAEPTPETGEALVLRYLAAYGPAATADIRAWSGLTGLPPVVARLRPRLRSFRDERGRTLLDVPDAPLPDPDTPAPARFLPAFDNAVLGFDDRSRIVDDADRGLSVRGARFLLVDGRVAGTWTTGTGEGGALHVDVALHRPLTAPERNDVLQEGEQLAAFLADGAPTGGVRLAAR
jgi:winged helix DNA-binding protein